MYQFKMKTVTKISEIDIITKEIIHRKLVKGSFNFHGLNGLKLEDIDNIEFFRIGKRVYYKVQLKNGIIEEIDVAMMPFAELLAIGNFASQRREI